MAITAAMVKELREMTGAGMMDCKKALTETNGDMDAAVDVLKKRGVPADHIIFMSLLCAPEGVETFQALHPDIELYTASLDDHLNEKAYIVPGLGDAGDRLYGTL